MHGEVAPSGERMGTPTTAARADAVQVTYFTHEHVALEALPPPPPIPFGPTPTPATMPAHAHSS